MRPDAVGERPELDVWWRIALLTLGTLTRATLRMRVAGIERVPRTGGALLVPNHLSVLDPIVVALACTTRGRATHFVTLAEHAARPILGWEFRKLGQVPIRRGLGDWGAIEELSRVVRSGSVGGIFPEGTIGIGRDLLPLHKGAARVALTAGASLLPVGIWGTQDRWPKGGFRLTRPLRARVGVVFGPPIPPEGDPRSRSDVRALTDRIATEIVRSRESAERLALSPRHP